MVVTPPTAVSLPAPTYVQPPAPAQNYVTPQRSPTNQKKKVVRDTQMIDTLVPLALIGGIAYMALTGSSGDESGSSASGGFYGTSNNTRKTPQRSYNNIPYIGGGGGIWSTDPNL